MPKRKVSLVTNSTTILRKSMFLLFAGFTLGSAFSNIRHPRQRQSVALLAKRIIRNNNERKQNRNLLSERLWERPLRPLAICASVVVTTLVLQPVPASLAAPPTLNEAIVELSETSYPILRALDPASFRQFSTKVGDVFLQNVKADKLGKSIELGIDALDSAPPEKLADFNAVLKEAYAGVDTDSCRRVPLPPRSVVDKFGSIAAEFIDSDKLKAFGETWRPSLDLLEKVKTSDETICLPASRASLDKLALAQADLARSFGKTETRAFVSYTGPVVKATITPKKVLPLVSDAKTLAPMASAQAKKDFAAAGKKAESASQLEIARNKVAEQKAKQAANRAAVGANASKQ